jgi:hypothetical protein
MLSAGCVDFCDIESCGENYQILRAVHDSCPEDTVSTSAEQGLHDLEAPCEAYNCYPKTSNEESALVCSETEGSDSNPESSVEGSSAASVIWGEVQLLTRFIATVFGVVLVLQL